MFFGSKCVKVAKMCILHIYTRADVNTLMHVFCGLMLKYGIFGVLELSMLMLLTYYFYPLFFLSFSIDK